MLTCFPDLYPDELFYSICARYSERMCYPSEEAVNRNLFNNLRVVQAIAFPCHLGTLMENLLLQIRKGMKGENEVLAYCRTGTLGVTGISSPKVEHLRFCHLCINEDRKCWNKQKTSQRSTEAV